MGGGGAGTAEKGWDLRGAPPDGEGTASLGKQAGRRNTPVTRFSYLLIPFNPPSSESIQKAAEKGLLHEVHPGTQWAGEEWRADAGSRQIISSMVPHYSKDAADTFCKQARSYSLKREGKVVSSIYSLWEALYVSFITTSARYFMLFHPHNNCVMGEIALFYKWSMGSLEEPRNWLHITLQGEEGAGMRPKNLLIS